MTARKNRIRLVGALLALVLSLSLGGCAVREGSADDGRLRVVTTLFRGGPCGRDAFALPGPRGAQL